MHLKLKQPNTASLVQDTVLKELQEPSSCFSKAGNSTEGGFLKKRKNELKNYWKDIVKKIFEFFDMGPYLYKQRVFFQIYLACIKCMPNFLWQHLKIPGKQKKVAPN